jgi:uncharacterized protein (TIGR00251 family)
MLVEVTVVPKSKRFSVSVKDGKVKIHLRSSPEDNKANIELIKELSKALKTDVRILSGHTSKRKKLEIGMDEENWEFFLSQQ